MFRLFLILWGAFLLFVALVLAIFFAFGDEKITGYAWGVIALVTIILPWTMYGFFVLEKKIDDYYDQQETPEDRELMAAYFKHIQNNQRRKLEIEEAEHQARLARIRRGEKDDEEPRF